MVQDKEELPSRDMDLHKHENLAYMNIRRFNKAKCNVMHLGQENLIFKRRSHCQYHCGEGLGSSGE